MPYKVKDIALAEEGMKRVEWAENQMSVLMKIREEFRTSKPFKDVRIGCALHVTKETAVLVKTLVAGGAQVALAAANPLSTQDDVAAALAKEGISVYAWAGENNEEYYENINKVLDIKPNITIDDGGDLVFTFHTKRTELINNIFGSQEETTTGIIRLRALERDGKLKVPVVAINDTPTKRLFDNVLGTSQSTMDGIIRATNILLAGKNFVVCGYGYCGSGLTKRARGMGANVIVAEVEPIKALQAAMEGYNVMPLKEVAKIGDIFVTVTGNTSVIRKEHMELMKDGAILANTGHFNVEISLDDLNSLTKSKRQVKKNVEEFTLKNGKRLYLLAEGRIVNLIAAEGHPSAIMDLSFSDQALSARWLVENCKKLEPKVYDVPKDIDERVAKLKLESMGIRIDSLTDEQKKYLESWEEGT